MAETCSTVEMIGCGLIQEHIRTVYTQTHALMDETTVKKKVKVLHFHSKLVPNEIHLRTLHTRTCTEMT